MRSGFIVDILPAIPVKENYEVVITFLEPVEPAIISQAELSGFLKGKVWMSDDFDAP